TPAFAEGLKAIRDEKGGIAVNMYLKDSCVCEYREVPDWLTLIRNSKVVVTDSFHCVCLALRFGKEVVYCPNEKRGQTRFDSLFNKFHIAVEPYEAGMQSRMFKIEKRGDIDVILENERKISLKFLMDVLN